eukprot:gene4317-6116_t
MFRTSETANDLFRRLNSPPEFVFRVDNNKTEKVGFGDIAEIQTSYHEITELVLGLIMQFNDQYDDGVIIHISTGNNLNVSLKQSHFDVTNSSLDMMNKTDRIKSFTIHSALQLIAILELLHMTLDDNKTLLLMEGLSPIILSLKSRCYGNGIDSTSLIPLIMKSIQNLKQHQVIIPLWITGVIPNMPDGLRVNPHSKDELSLLWKQNIPKIYHFSID